MSASRFSISPWALLTGLAFFGSVWAWQQSGRVPGAPRTVAAGGGLASHGGGLASHEVATIDLFHGASPAVVNIMNLDVRRSGNWMRMNETAIPRGSGTGFVWDDDGYIVTNFHVVANADAIVVTLADHSEWQAEVVGTAADFDLAVVRIDAPRSKLPALPIGVSRDLLVGQSVYAIGNPFGLDQTLTTGVISGLNREINTLTQRRIQNVIQTDAAINPGNSGGPLLDSSGRLIGVNTAIVSPSGVSVGIGFALPVDTVSRVVPELIDSGHFVRPAIGIQLVPDNVTRKLNKAGVFVGRVVPRSGAAQAGLRDIKVANDGSVQGDLIVGIDGKAVQDSNDLLHILAQYQVGDRVQVEFVRDGRERSVEVQLQSLE